MQTRFLLSDHSSCSQTLSFSVASQYLLIIAGSRKPSLVVTSKISHFSVIEVLNLQVTAAPIAIRKEQLNYFYQPEKQVLLKLSGTSN